MNPSKSVAESTGTPAMACGFGRLSPSSSLNCCTASWISSSRTTSSTRLKGPIFTPDPFGSSLRSEPVEPRRVAGADQLALGRRHVGELALHHGLRIGPRRGGVGEVRRPQDVLDPEVVALPEAEFVIHERDGHVAPEVLARRELQTREIVGPGRFAI